MSSPGNQTKLRGPLKTGLGLYSQPDVHTENGQPIKVCGEKSEQTLYACPVVKRPDRVVVPDVWLPRETHLATLLKRSYLDWSASPPAQPEWSRSRTWGNE